MLDRPAARARYALGNVARLLSRPWLQKDIHPVMATTIFGCSFGDGGWHHIRRTLVELDANPGLRASDSTLARFLTQFCPRSVSTLAGVDTEEPLPLFVYPWGAFHRGRNTLDKDPWASRFCGPSTEQFVADEFSRIVDLYRDIRDRGYRPTTFPNSYIAGSWLISLSGDKRFVVMQGNHRMAVLAHLGCTRIAVRTTRASLRCVREAALESWPLVASGRCSIEHARKVFRFFFEQNGRHIAV